MKKLLLVLIFGMAIFLNGCTRNSVIAPNDTTSLPETKPILSTQKPESKEVKIQPEKALELLVKSHGSWDTRIDKGFSYDGIDNETGYYMFSWCNPGKGTGARFNVDPYTGEVYSMGNKTSNLLESSESEKSIVTTTTDKEMLHTESSGKPQNTEDETDIRFKDKTIEDRALTFLPPLKTLHSAKDACCISSKYNENLSYRDGSFEEYPAIYLYQDNMKQVIIAKTEDEIIRYELPEDLPAIEDTYTIKNCRNRMQIADSSYNKHTFYLKAEKDELGRFSIFEIDTDNDTILEHEYLSLLEGHESPAWTFHGELAYNYIEAYTDSSLIVHATDGGYSGHHVDDYLYGVNKKTGEKIWSVYGYSYGFDFLISSDEKTIWIMTCKVGSQKQLDYHRLICMEIDTGNIIWEKLFDYDSFGFLGFVNSSEIVSNSFITIHIKEKNESGSSSKIKAIDIKNGDTLWEHALPFDFIYSVNDDATKFVIKDNDRMLQYNINTGETKMISGDAEVLYSYPSNTKSIDWVNLEKSFKLINADTGEVISSIEKNKKTDRLDDVDENTVLVKSDEIFHVYKTDGTPLWEKEERVFAFTSKDGLIYYVTDSKIVCAELETGNPIWDDDFEFIFPKIADVFSAVGKPLIFEDQIIVNLGNYIFTFDKNTGEFKYQLGNLWLGHEFVAAGRIYQHDDGLYICYSDGYIDFYEK